MSKILTYLKLGPVNLFRVIFYRFSLRLPVSALRYAHVHIGKGPFFLVPSNDSSNDRKKSIPWNDLRYFGWRTFPEIGNPPNWHNNPFNNKVVKEPNSPWWTIPDFSLAFGDIKTFWEASRFDWAVQLAYLASQGQFESLVQLNSWVEDWCKKNPCYKGINWKCGQEASIRVLHMSIASLLLGQSLNATSGFLDFIEAHLFRIFPTIGYALAQNNNHGTSEAAALFVGGEILKANGRRSGDRYALSGRRILENRAKCLIAEDGSFSQYSLNYHRLVLDTYSLAEAWRRFLNLPSFSYTLYKRLSYACEWLFTLIDPKKGHGPNLGGNDGAKLFPLEGEDYRDYRSSVQFAMCLFKKQRAYNSNGAWDILFNTFHICSASDHITAVQSHLYDKGGYAVLKRSNALVMIRYPRYHFRPSHADALHVDLWVDGNNLLRDGGSYSYSADQQWLEYFSGIESHNTVQFDDHDQMPRISRFLFDNWLKVNKNSQIELCESTANFTVSYRDYKKDFHKRFILLDDSHLEVKDIIGGFTKKAVLRWRLSPGLWAIKDYSVKNNTYCISVNASMPIKRFELKTGWESLYYMQKTEIPVLEVEFNVAGTIYTEYRWRT